MINKLPLSLIVLVASIVCTSTAVILSALTMIFHVPFWFLFLSPFLAFVGIVLGFAAAFLASKQAPSDGNTIERAERQRRWMHGDEE